MELHCKICLSFEDVKAQDSFLEVTSRTLWSNSCIRARVSQTKSVNSPLKANDKHEDRFIDMPFKINDSSDEIL